MQCTNTESYGKTEIHSGSITFCNPDLEQLDFWLLPKLKEMLEGRRFSTVVEVQAAMIKWIQSQPVSFFVDGMKKWIKRLSKCLAVSGDYVEK
ncbi:hypothetical protein TNCV_922991 [Trichonephila clavipes]|nr:hypothetical protein TNCV_922991 [Trichonephila clavipes]